MRILHDLYCSRYFIETKPTIIKRWPAASNHIHRDRIRHTHHGLPHSRNRNRTHSRIHSRSGGSTTPHGGSRMARSSGGSSGGSTRHMVHSSGGSSGGSTRRMVHSSGGSTHRTRNRDGSTHRIRIRNHIRPRVHRIRHHIHPHRSHSPGGSSKELGSTCTSCNKGSSSNGSSRVGNTGSSSRSTAFCHQDVWQCRRTWQ
ncbi:hypothetical protein GGI20_003121 [Coemansia sp. BCRC 34301]|nr:hypothetical protein GGI20_003121 [Coemansia sp. BCRC 34301]